MAAGSQHKTQKNYWGIFNFFLTGEFLNTFPISFISGSSSHYDKAEKMSVQIRLGYRREDLD